MSDWARMMEKELSVRLMSDFCGSGQLVSLSSITSLGQCTHQLRVEHRRQRVDLSTQPRQQSAPNRSSLLNLLDSRRPRCGLPSCSRAELFRASRSLQRQGSEPKGLSERVKRYALGVQPCSVCVQSWRGSAPRYSESTENACAEIGHSCGVGVSFVNGVV